MTMPQRQSRPGGFLRLVLALFFLVLLLDLVGMNVLFFGAIGAAAGGKQTLVSRVTLSDGDSGQIVAVIPVTGLITDDSYHQLDNALTEAERDKNVKAVVLDVDTPGGSASASDEMFHRLSLFKQRRDDVKVIVSMGSMATSGGYYVSCGGDTLFAEPGTMTANIGVLMPSVNISELMQKWGIQDATIVGTGGTYKDAGSPLRPETEQGKEYLQGLVDATLKQFKTVVIDSRFKGVAPPDADQIFDGRVLMAQDALSRGLVDKIGYLEDAESFAAAGAGLSSPKYERFDPVFPLFARLMGADSLNSLGSSRAGATVDIDGVDVDVRQLATLLASRPVYLWAGN